MPNLTGLAALIKRAQVLASSALSWLSALLAVLVVLAQQLEAIGGVPEWATRLLASAIAFIGVAIAQVRRVTPVSDADKGLLPPKGPAVEVLPAQPLDAGVVTFQIVFLALAIVCFVVFALIAHGTFVSEEGLTWLGGGLALFAAAHLP